jgi:hypothetical protein
MPMAEPATMDLNQLDAFHALLPALAGSLDIRDVFQHLSAVASRIVPHDEANLVLATDDGTQGRQAEGRLHHHRRLHDGDAADRRAGRSSGAHHRGRISFVPRRAHPSARPGDGAGLLVEAAARVLDRGCDLYRETASRYGYPADRLKVGVHAPGYVARTTQEAADVFFPGFARAVTDVGKERGWPPMTRAGFDAQRGPQGALLIGSPDEVVEKIVRHSDALGGISRISFQMNAASLPHAKLLEAIETIGMRVAPLLREV